MWGTNHDFTTGQIDRLGNAMTKTAMLSLLCSVCIVVTHWMFPSLRKRSSELIVYMSFATMGANITVLSLLQASRSGGTGACTAFGFFSVFFFVAEAIWAAIIAHTLSLVLVQRNALMAQVGHNDGNKDMRRVRVLRFHAVAWGTSFVFAVIPTISGYFAVNNDWCWYDSGAASGSTSSNIMEIFTYVVPLGVAVVFCFTIFCCVMWNLKSIRESALRTKDPLNLQLYELTSTLKYYPVVVMVTEGYNVGLKIAAYVNPNADLFYCFLVLAVLMQSQGTLYCVAYFLRPGVRRVWFDKVCGAPLADTYCTLVCCFCPVDRTGEKSFLNRLPDLLHLENASTMSQSQAASRVVSMDGGLERQESTTLRSYQRSISGERSVDGSLPSFVSNPMGLTPIATPTVDDETGVGNVPPIRMPSSGASRTSLNLDSGDDDLDGDYP